MWHRLAQYNNFLSAQCLISIHAPNNAGYRDDIDENDEEDDDDIDDTKDDDDEGVGVNVCMDDDDDIALCFIVCSLEWTKKETGGLPFAWSLVDEPLLIAADGGVENVVVADVVVLVVVLVVVAFVVVVAVVASKAAGGTNGGIVINAVDGATRPHLSISSNRLIASTHKSLHSSRSAHLTIALNANRGL